MRGIRSPLKSPDDTFRFLFSGSSAATRTPKRVLFIEKLLPVEGQFKVTCYILSYLGFIYRYSIRSLFIQNN
jgi:hypothetical protein